MKIIYLLLLIAVATCEQKINVDALREATQLSQMENKTKNGEKYQKDKVIYLNPGYLKKVVATHKFDIIYGICSDAHKECTRFQQIWHELSLKYDKPDVLIAVLNSKDPEAKRYIDSLHNYKEPYIMFYPHCKNEEEYRYEYGINYNELYQFLEDNTGMPCDDD